MNGRPQTTVEPEMKMVMPKNPWLATAALFIVTGPPSKASDPQLYLQDYATPNTTLRAGFVPCKAQLVLGEPLRLTFSVENLGPRGFAFRFGGDWQPTGRHNRFKITVTDTNGNVLPDPRATQFEMGGMVQPVWLSPGQSFSNVIDLLDFRTIDKPGEYAIECRFAFDERWTAKKDQTNPVVSAAFKLWILERTPERVLQVLDELVAKAQASRGKELADILGLAAHFGGKDAVPPLGQIAAQGTTELRVASLGALSLIPADESLEILLKRMNDPDTAIRIAAIGALGVIQMPRAADALIAALPGEPPPVAKALLRALGTCKSERALPVLTNVLEAARWTCNVPQSRRWPFMAGQAPSPRSNRALMPATPGYSTRWFWPWPRSCISRCPRTGCCPCS